MAKHRSAREQVLTLLASRTQKEVAKKLGVSERTIRRWKNEGVEPSLAHRAVLSKRSRDERDRIRKAQKSFSAVNPKTGIREKKPIPFSPMPIQIYGTRQWVRDYANQTYRLSDNVFFEVSELDIYDTFEVLRALRDSEDYAGFQFTMRGPASPDYPMGFYSSGQWQFESKTDVLSDSDLLDILEEERNYVDHVMRIITFPVPEKYRKQLARKKRRRAIKPKKSTPRGKAKR